MADTFITKEIARVLKEDSIGQRGLPHPQADVDSLYETVVALKESVEQLYRNRGPAGNSAVLVRELEPILEIVQSLVGGSATASPGVPGNTPGTGVTVHANLEGLDADDHKQYGTRDSIDIQVGFKTAYTTAYKEFTYSAGKVAAIEIWENDGKITKLFTKTLTYNANGQATEIQTADELSGLTLTKSLTYNGVEVATLTEVVS